MAISQEFQKHLSSGNLAEAMKLALSEMIELRISTRVVSEDGSADDRPGHQINTRINIVDGDIENEIGSVFLNNGPYSELRSFHAQQVADAQKIIRTNIESLQTLLGLLLQGLNRPSGQEPSADFQGTETGFGGMGAAMVTVAAGTAALGTMAMGASTAGVSTAGITAEVSTVGDSTATTSTAASFTAGIGDGIGSGIGAEAQAQSFGAIGQFNAIEPIGLESIAPAALTPESEEPESFSALDGAGAWSEDEDLGVEGEPLSFLTETELGTQEPFATLTDEPLGALDLGVMASEGTIGELYLALPERSEERSEDLDFVMDSDSLPTEEAFDLSLTEEPEPSFSLDEMDESEALDLTEPSDSFLALDSEEDSDRSESLGFLDVAPDSATKMQLDSEAGSEAESSLGFDEDLRFGEDLGFEMMQPVDQFSEDNAETIEPSGTPVSSLEPFSDDFPEDGIATLQEQAFSAPLEPFNEVLEPFNEEPFNEDLEAPLSEDDFVLPSFEEPMAGLDIPEDLPDPLADLSFTTFGAATSEPEAGAPEAGEEELDLMGEDLVGEDLMGGDQDLEDPAIWNLAEESEIETDIASEAELDLEPETFSSEFETDEAAESPAIEEGFSEEAEASEEWSFEMTEPSPNFSLEGTEDIDLGLDETTGDSFTKEEPVGELSDDFEVDSFEADNFEVDNFGAESFEADSFEADSFENEGDFEADFGDEDLGQLSEDQLSEVDLMEDQFVEDQILETDLSDADLGTPEGFDELEDFPETIEPVGAQPTDDLEMEDLEMEGLEMTDLPMPDLEVPDLGVPDLGVPDLAMEEMPSDSLDIADFATEAMEDLDLGSPSDSLELDSIEEMQGLEEIEDMEPLSDLADFSDDSFSEDSFSDTSAPDDQDLDLGDGLDALADMATTEEPQTFEEWEGIVPPGRASLSVPDVEEIDSSEWAIDESPSLSAGLEDLDDNWDDSDLDDMALSPEEMETSQPIHFDREEPLVGDAMGLADLDAMDSLFQNSDDNFDDQDSAGLAELDPFLDLEDPFDEVDESEEDPFASLDEDAPMFPPPPPRPGR